MGRYKEPRWNRGSSVSVFQQTKNGMKLLEKDVSHIEAMDYVWSEYNTEETPIHIYDNKTGMEIEW